ncbi:restriction endonuclease subunit S [Serratia fonticola]|uniref:restriction endonuclease subunit S n=1 Tax=Serratia fonticola TaxID=47917 RepID=UPI00093CEDE2|nr:restriction endonuclease subunit S [Serratia fonticola]OKP27546.1 type I restriction endonuclease subunit S [Serratia fonticola]
MAVEKLITDHIDIWSSALQTRSTAGRGSNGKIDLYGIKKLRELILELAVRGKLVPQDPNDEPASELLKRIAAEKAELVKQGKIKKQKPLPEISEDDKPFELPGGWEWTTLKNICVLENGDRSKNYPNKSTLVEFGVPFVNAGHLVNGEIDRSEMTFIKEEHFNSLRSGKFHHGDILFCLRGSLGKSALVENLSGAIASSLVIIRVFPLVDGEYVNLYFNTPLSYRYIKRYDNGTAQPNLAATDLERFLVPIPSFFEQKRIIAKINELMSLCDQLEQQSLTSLGAHQQLVETLLATLTDSQNAEELTANWARISQYFDTLFTTEASIDALQQTILQLAVMGLLIESAEFSQLDHLKKHLSFGPKNGLSPSEVKYETDIKVLKLGATSYGYLKLQETKYVDIDVSDKLHLFLKKNDILIQRGNSSNFVGCSLLIEEDFDNLIYPDLMMKIKTKDELLPEYATLWLSSPFARNYMWSKMTGTSGTMPKISKKVVEDVPIAVPPLAVQHQLVIKIKELFLLCGSLKSRLQSAQQNQLHLADALTDAVLN